MAGIGFELKKLYSRQGLFNKVKALGYSSLVTIGPMLSCVLLVSVIQGMLLQARINFIERELFMACIIYAITFSYLVTSILNTYVTRAVSDFMFQGHYGALLPSFHGTITLNYLIGGVPAILFLLLIDIPLFTKLMAYILFMILITLWTQTVYITAMNQYRRISIAFFTGSLIAILVAAATLHWTSWQSAGVYLLGVNIGFAITAVMLLTQIERFYRTEESLPTYSFFAYIDKYASLIITGFLTSLGLYSHQFVTWMGPDGEWVGGAFRMAPQYDVAVYYAFISAIPSLVMFVVFLETAFYPKYRNYYSAILSKGSIIEINRCKSEMYQVLVRQLTKMIEYQLLFSVAAIAIGIRLLPYIGFSSSQIEMYINLVIGFFVYIIYNTITMVLLYFDDRRGVAALAAAFLILNTGCAVVSLFIGGNGFSFFVASFLTLTLALWRLVYLMRNLNYFTFSAQPLINKQSDNKYARMLRQSQGEE